MPRWSLLLILGVAVVCAGVGITLGIEPLGITGFGWTAYAPLPRRYATYQPVDPTWLLLRRPIGAALLALGAGTAGAVVAALVLRGRGDRGRRMEPVKGGEGDGARLP